MKKVQLEMGGKSPLVVLDVPLLYETCGEKRTHAVVVVTEDAVLAMHRDRAQDVLRRTGTLSWAEAVRFRVKSRSLRECNEQFEQGEAIALSRHRRSRSRLGAGGLKAPLQHAASG